MNNENSARGHDGRQSWLNFHSEVVSHLRSRPASLTRHSPRKRLATRAFTVDRSISTSSSSTARQPGPHPADARAARPEDRPGHPGEVSLQALPRRAQPATVAANRQPRIERRQRDGAVEDELEDEESGAGEAAAAAA